MTGPLWQDSPRRRRPWGRGEESGQALVEFALVLPLLILIMAVAFNGWNGMQLSQRLTSAARAGAIQAANDLATDLGNQLENSPTLTGTPDQPCSGPSDQLSTALADATTDINNEEDSPGVYQCTDPTANNYVTLTTGQDNIGGTPPLTMNVLTISITKVSVSLVPVVGNFFVSVHASARYS
jgi:Flp pilus assembly protein TadG